MGPADEGDALGAKHLGCLRAMDVRRGHHTTMRMVPQACIESQMLSTASYLSPWVTQEGPAGTGFEISGDSRRRGCNRMLDQNWGCFAATMRERPGWDLG